jgi:hypothetical protein
MLKALRNKKTKMVATFDFRLSGGWLISDGVWMGCGGNGPHVTPKQPN